MSVTFGQLISYALGAALNTDDIKGIIRYDSSSTSDPTTSAYSYTDSCADEASSDLVPYLAIAASDTGDDFWVLGSGYGQYDSANANGLQLTDAPRRDVAMMPGSGYLVIAFKTNNPGAWLMHYHIAWHTAR
ncbi:hypothetical protein LQW54_002310 [Pestalotiopsis sp. IQ-011]